MRQVQVPWPQAADAGTLSSLACATFRSAVQDQPFRISRVVLALQYCIGSDTAPPASEKRRRGSSVPLSPQPAQQSILRFVSSSTPAATAMQMDNAVVAAAASGGASRAAALAARGERATLRSFFAPSVHADGNIAAAGRAAHSTAAAGRAAHSTAAAGGSSVSARDVGGEGCGRGGSVGCERLGTAGARDGADKKEQKKINGCERVDVVVID